MWLSTLIAGAARIRRRPLILHHHSYEYVRCRRRRAVVLALIAGPTAQHVVLGPTMERDLRVSVPEVSRISVLNNAGFVLPGYPQGRTRPRSSAVALGHMSNLTEEKGVVEVVDTAIRLLERGLDIRLLLAGPAIDGPAEAAISRADRVLKTRFSYLGAVDQRAKAEFFQSIDYFLFPSRFANEAAPLVVLEALSWNIPCIASRRGCIPDQLGLTGGLLVSDDEDFYEQTAGWIAADLQSDHGLAAPRHRFEELLDEHHSQFSELLPQDPRRHH